MPTPTAREPTNNTPPHIRSIEELRAENEQLRDLVIQLSTIVARHATQRP